MPLHYINGKFVRGSSGETIAVQNPATEETLDTVARGTATDAESALISAKDAYDRWRKTSANVRAQMMHDAAAKMRAHKDEIVKLLTLEQGKPIPENEEEFEWLANTLTTTLSWGVMSVAECCRQASTRSSIWQLRNRMEWCCVSFRGTIRCF